MRIDRLLWFLRLAKTRSAAQALIVQGHARVNGRRIDRTAHDIRVGDILVLPLPSSVTVIELLAMPDRRGPASEAQSCYRVLDAGQQNPIAPQSVSIPEGTVLP